MSPFVGLFGAVWGIYHAMISISTEGSVSLDKVAGPVGGGLDHDRRRSGGGHSAVLAYNIFGKFIVGLRG